MWVHERVHPQGESLSLVSKKVKKSIFVPSAEDFAVSLGQMIGLGHY